jgi:hypothetical protein
MKYIMKAIKLITNRPNVRYSNQMSSLFLCAECRRSFQDTAGGPQSDAIEILRQTTASFICRTFLTWEFLVFYWSARDFETSNTDFF